MKLQNYYFVLSKLRNNSLKKFLILSSSTLSHLGPDHVQLSKVFWGLKVNWKNFSTKMRKYFPIHFTSSESCALSKVNWNQRKSIGTHISQLELTKNAE